MTIKKKITKVRGLASDWIQSVKSSAGGGLGTAQEFVRKHPVTSAVSVGGGVLAGVTVTQIMRKRIKKRGKTKKPTTKKRVVKRKTARAKRSKRSWQLDRARISKQKHEVAYQKRKKRLARGKKTKKRVGKIYYTKRGQPYKILANGRARFIKGRKKK